MASRPITRSEKLDLRLSKTAKQTLQAAAKALHKSVSEFVHAKDDKAASFCRHFGFIQSPTDNRHLYMLIKDIRAIASGY